jgi:hypothetical protein
LSNLRQRDGLRCSTAIGRKIDDLIGRICDSRSGTLWLDAKLEGSVFPSNSAVLCLALERWLCGLRDLVVDASADFVGEQPRIHHA